MFAIVFAALAREHLEALRPFERNRILDEVAAQLAATPNAPTTKRKMLIGATPSFEHVPPVWQLRVGDHRVIYDVDAGRRIVVVRAILRKGNKTTGEIL
jgi:mRNA-degrading endonuclease RelE of RelBE toxin-antitoxin system